MNSKKRIACWMSDKKLQKFNWKEFEYLCNRNGFETFKLNLEEDIETQGPFHVFIHKLTDIITLSNQGDQKSSKKLLEIEQYLIEHPTVVVLDPITNVQRLLDRYKCYSIIHEISIHNSNVVTPNFCEIKTNDVSEISKLLTSANVTYPFICKPLIGHGAKAHQMSIIFGERSLKDCKPPCVAQSFVNHNAILYKIFVVGEKMHVCERPSLKNFYAGDRETIYFDSSAVSKATSQSRLTVLDEEDREREMIIKPDPEVMEAIALSLREAFGLDLFGVDIVIENGSGKYAVVDVNSFPGYDGFPDFCSVLIECIKEKVTKKKN